MKKNILFSMDYMYGCREEIEKEFNQRFNNVRFIDHYLPPRKNRSFLFKILRELNKKKFFSFFIKKHLDKIIRDYYLNNVLSFSEKIDYFFVIAGQEFSREFIQDVREKNPGVVCLIYLWDKLEHTTLKNIVYEFDYIFSFDREDCKNYGFIFRPFFFLKNFGKKILYENRKYDISYIGALRDYKRYKFIETIYKLSNMYNLKNFIFLIKDKKVKFLDLKDNSFISDTRISPDKNLDILKESRIICEIPFDNQVGLTLRALQSLYFENKIITTNQDFKNYKFYNEKNIKIVDSLEEIYEIDKSFFIDRYEKVETNIIDEYTAETFVKTIFDMLEGIDR